MLNSLWRRWIVIGLVAFISFGSARAACPSYEDVMKYVNSYWERQTIPTFPDIVNASDAYCAQGRVAAAIGWHMGTPAGYGIALSNDQARRDRGALHPVRGFLFKHMFLDSGASIPEDFAAAPVISADLIAVAKSDFQRVSSPADLLEQIEYLLPFVRLDDASGDDGRGALALIATNLGTRYGVLGAPIPVEHSQAFYDKLESMRVVMTDAQGKQLGVGRGSEVMGHPLRALHWLGRDLEYNAQRIQPGDRLSVGAFFAPVAAHAGAEITVRYIGLPGEPSVSIRIGEPLGRIQNIAEQPRCFTDSTRCRR